MARGGGCTGGGGGWMHVHPVHPPWVRHCIRELQNMKFHPFFYFLGHFYRIRIRIQPTKIKTGPCRSGSTDFLKLFCCLFLQAVQMQFLSAVESLNPEEIMRILNSHPLHIDSMLQLSDICKMGEDSAMATELIGN
jgi:hypothetical protein